MVIEKSSTLFPALLYTNFFITIATEGFAYFWHFRLETNMNLKLREVMTMRISSAYKNQTQNDYYCLYLLQYS